MMLRNEIASRLRCLSLDMQDVAISLFELAPTDDNCIAHSNYLLAESKKVVGWAERIEAEGVTV